MADTVSHNIPAPSTGDAAVQFEAIFNASSLGIILVDQDLRITRLNPAGLKILEADSTDQVRTHTVTSLITPGYVDQCRRDTTAVFEGAESVVRTIEVAGLRGGRRWIESQAIGLSNPSDHGRAQHALLLMRDVTQDRHVAELLRHSENNYRHLFENAFDAIIIFRPEDEVVLKVNDNACALYGLSRDEFVGLSLADVSQDVSRGRDHIKKLLQHGEQLHFETKQFRNDGTVIPLDVNAFKIEYDGQEAILSINRDMSTRLKIESRLVEAERREVLAQLAGSIAHEFNNMLLAASIYIQGSPEPQTASIAKAASLIQQAHSLSASLLEMYAGPKDTTPRALQIATWLPNCITSIRETLPSGISVRLGGINDISPVGIDPLSLEQVLRILLSNASDAIRGLGVIDVTVGQPSAGEYIEIRVIDTGPGIPERDRARVFDPFFTTRNRGRRSGLGLAIATRLLEQVDGRLFYECNQPRGSIFIVQLPRALE